MIVTGEVAAVGVNVTEHDPEASVHVVDENVPVGVLVQDTVPLGEVPLTVAVHVVGDPEATDEGEQFAFAEVD